MLLLTTTSEQLVIAVTGTAPVVQSHASYVDHSAGTFTPGRRNRTAITSASPVEIVPSPAASTQRNIHTLVVVNGSLSNVVRVNISIDTGAGLLALESRLLLPLARLTFMDGVGFTVLTPNQDARRLRLASNVVSSSVTSSEVLGLQRILPRGTWVFRYSLVYQCAVTTTNAKFDVNFSGADLTLQNTFVVNHRWVDSNTLAATGPSQDQTSLQGGLMSAFARRAPNQTTIAMSTAAMVANVDYLYIIEGYVDVASIATSASNILGLFFASRVAAQTVTLRAGSCLWLESFGER